MRLEIEIGDEDLCKIITQELERCADMVYAYRSKTSNRAAREDYKTYLALITASNYFKVPSDQTRARKFIEE